MAEEEVIETENSNEEKSNKFNFSVIKKLLKYTRSYFWMIGLAVLFSSIASLLMIIGADKVSDVVDKISDSIAGEANLTEIKNLVLMITFMYFIYMLFSNAQGIVMAMVNQKMVFRLRNDLEAKRRKLSMTKLGSLNTGDTLSVMTNDVARLSMAFGNLAIQLIPAIVLITGTLIVMISKNILLTLTLILSSIIGFVFFGNIMSKSQKLYRKQQSILGEMNGHIEEVYSGEVIVKAFGCEQIEEDKFDEINGRMRRVNYKTFCFQALMMPISTLMNNLGYISVCVIGAMLIAKGSITFGLIASFMMYLNYFQTPISQIGSSVQQLMTMVASSERVFAFFEQDEMPQEDNPQTKFENAEGNVEFRNIMFGYNPEEKMVIHDLSLTVKKGQKIAIVGHTGAGKTTLINLLLRFYELNAGEILIDEKSISDIPKENLRDQFSIVPQDTWIFSGTIRDNITLSKDDISDEELDKICRIVGLDYYISMLPDGYDTLIDEKSGLSHGQKQQFSIARAMLSNKKMLILDEATSSIDVLLEQKLQKSMDRLVKGRTSFIIAHRLSTIKNADVIIVMEDGNVVESGRHDELLNKGGTYSELYYSQFRFEENDTDGTAAV